MNGHWPRITGAIAGVIFAVCLFLSLAVVDPLRQATDAELTDWWSSNSNLDDSIVSMYLRLLAIPFLLAFLAQVRAFFRSADNGSWSDLAHSSGIVCAAMLGVSALVRGVTAQSIRLDDEPLPGVDTLRFATELSYQAYGTAAIGALAVTAGVTALIILRTNVLPRWLGWLSLPLAALSLIAVALQAGAFASPLLLIWALATSFCLARVQSTAADEAASPPVLQPTKSFN